MDDDAHLASSRKDIDQDGIDIGEYFLQFSPICFHHHHGHILYFTGRAIGGKEIAQHYGELGRSSIDHKAELVGYAASKCAQVSMVRTLAKQVAPFGVTVNNLAPGVIDTDRNRDALSDQAYRAQIIDQIPVRFIGQSEDCVGPALLLCSNAGRYITGEDLMVDGGRNMP